MKSGTTATTIRRALRIFWTAVLLAGALAEAALGGVSSPAAANGIILYVDWEATGAGDGTSWDDAFIDLQMGLDAAAAGDEIWVAEGTYRPSVEHGGVGDRYWSFQMLNQVAIYGGFDPSMGDVEWEDRDWVNNVTTLSGDILIVGNPFDNCYHVFYHPNGLDSTAILDGFTITGGYADTGGFQSGGGGMFNHYSSPTLANCTFEANFAVGGGGGMWNAEFSSPVLTNCIFEANFAVGGGGGMWNNDLSSPVLTNCIFEANSADIGGGMLNYDLSSPVLTNCIFEDNTALSGGGGVCSFDSSPTLTNCIFTDNSVTSRGGGMYSFSSTPVLTNCTFTGNYAGDDGGGMFSRVSSPLLVNCILWGDAPNEVGNDDSSPEITYSDIQGGYPGQGNIDVDPLWVDPDNGDLHLGGGSPCIDSGTNDADLPPFDFEGDERIMDGDGDHTAVVDMGVDEALAMYVGDIVATFVTDPLERRYLRASVLVVDQGGMPLPGVIVEASIWVPTGGPFTRSRYTKPTGFARFTWGSLSSGSWTLCVDDLALEGYHYVPAGNVVTCEDWQY